MEKSNYLNQSAKDAALKDPVSFWGTKDVVEDVFGAFEFSFDLHNLFFHQVHYTYIWYCYIEPEVHIPMMSNIWINSAWLLNRAVVNFYIQWKSIRRCAICRSSFLCTELRVCKYEYDTLCTSKQCCFVDLVSHAKCRHTWFFVCWWCCQ